MESDLGVKVGDEDQYNLHFALHLSSRSKFLKALIAKDFEGRFPRDALKVPDTPVCWVTCPR